MKVLPLSFDDAHMIEDGPSQSNKGFVQGSEETPFNLHEMFDVNDDVGDLVPDVEGCDLFCSESLSDEVDHNVPFSSITLQESDNTTSGGMVYPPIEIGPSNEIFNDANDHLNQRISDDELSQSDSDTEDVQMEEQNRNANINVTRWNSIDNDDVHMRNRVQDRDRRVPDLNGSFYDSDEERNLSSCSDSDHVVPNLYMEE